MSSTELLERVGLDESARAAHLALLDIGAADRALMAELLPFFRECVDEIIDQFYEYILRFPEALEWLTEPALVTRLKQAQRSHFLSLASGTYDADYFESRLRVGMAHAKIRLPPHLYLGGYTVQMRLLMHRLRGRFGDEPDRLIRYQEVILKVVMLDIALATDAYIYSGFVEKSLADAHQREAARATEALRAKEDGERRREELLSMVVHDIRSPVTAMMATARVGLRRYANTEEAPGKQFRLIETTGNSVLGIIDNMLTVARMSQGQIPINCEAFDVVEVVRACIDELLPFSQQTGHGVLFAPPAPSPVRALDKILVRRIVSNLLVNAFRHTPVGTHVAVTCGTENGRCLIRVADDGPGLSKTALEKLFDDPGAAGHRSSGAYIDSGLGLPFCRLACERLGGTIRADTESVRGTCFIVDLPAD